MQNILSSMRRVFSVSMLVLAMGAGASWFGTPTFAAGFAKQSLFLSQAAVYEGQTVFIYSVVTNDKPTPFKGELRFSEEKGLIGSTPITLDPGRASTVSTTWKPSAGQHLVTAALVSEDNQTTESQDATFFVNELQPAVPPTAEGVPIKNEVAKPTTSTTSVDTSQPVADLISRVSPKLATGVGPLLEKIDGGRQSAVTKLDQNSTWAQEQIKQAASAPTSLTNTLWMILSTLALYACAAATYVLSNIGIFYPIIACAFFFILWRIYKYIQD